MRKLTYFIACSMDGFIGDPDGDASSMGAFVDEEFLGYLTSEHPETVPSALRAPRSRWSSMTWWRPCGR